MHKRKVTQCENANVLILNNLDKLLESGCDFPPAKRALERRFPRIFSATQSAEPLATRAANAHGSNRLI
ncbi:MAG: hypothetical protein EAZ42_09015 [Verrucomicrobia bacterium]|nr:MAG: hypothetical protein EAZ42_09015 [Verrucomicrobiota bacterium]